MKNWDFPDVTIMTLKSSINKTLVLTHTHTRTHTHIHKHTNIYIHIISLSHTSKRNNCPTVTECFERLVTSDVSCEDGDAGIYNLFA
jgi:hypothetical protein